MLLQKILLVNTEIFHFVLVLQFHSSIFPFKIKVVAGTLKNKQIINKELHPYRPKYEQLLSPEIEIAYLIDYMYKIWL